MVGAYLRGPGVSQTAFCRRLAKLLPDPTFKFQSKQLRDFQSKNSTLAGDRWARIEFDDRNMVRLCASPILALHATTIKL